MRYSQMDAIALQHGTDKSSGWHGYIEHYERHLRHLVDQEFTLLELGVGPEHKKGASLFTWRDYFRKAHIVGVDIRPDAKDVEGDRISVEIGDCSDAGFLQFLAQRYRPRVVVDDASHIWSHQTLSMRTLIPMLPSESIFIMEDLHTSFGAYRHKPLFADQSRDTADLVMALALGVLGGQKSHPRVVKLELSAEDLLALGRIVEVAFVRSSAIITIADQPAPAAGYQNWLDRS